MKFVLTAIAGLFFALQLGIAIMAISAMISEGFAAAVASVPAWLATSAAIAAGVGALNAWRTTTFTLWLRTYGGMIAAVLPVFAMASVFPFASTGEADLASRMADSLATVLPVVLIGGLGWFGLLVSLALPSLQAERATSLSATR